MVIFDLFIDKDISKTRIAIQKAINQDQCQAYICLDTGNDQYIWYAIGHETEQPASVTYRHWLPPLR